MIRIALISDIHFGKDGRGDFTFPNENATFGKLNTEGEMSANLITTLQKLKPEYLFIAGDLTSAGSPAEYYYCEQKINNIAASIGINKDRIIWCVGNHDNDWRISKLADVYTKDHAGPQYDSDVEKISFDAYSNIASSVVDNCIHNLSSLSNRGCFSASGIYEDGNMIVFVLNSASKCMHYEKIDHGEITDKQLKWLESKLNTFQDDKRWKIVLLHHHPFNYSYPEIGVDVSLLSDGSQFQEIAGKGGVNLVLHGHRHHPRCKTQNETGWKNPISFICAGSLSVNEKGRLNGTIPNMFHIIDLEDDNIGQLYLRSYEFLPGSGWLPSTKRGNVVPIDSVMRLGRIVSQTQMKCAIEQMVQTEDSILSFEWDELIDDLQFNPCDEVNEMINKTLMNRFDVKAKLPDNLTLKRKAVK